RSAPRDARTSHRCRRHRLRWRPRSSEQSPPGTSSPDASRPSTRPKCVRASEASSSASLSPKARRGTSVVSSSSSMPVRSALQVARLNLEWTVVRAPISGRVGRAEITPGNVVQSGPPSPTLLTTIVSLNPIYVYFDTDEQAYLKYMSGTGAGPNGREVQVGL